MRQIGVTVYAMPEKPQEPLLTAEVWTTDKAGNPVQLVSIDIVQSKVFDLMPGQELRIKSTRAKIAR